MPILKSEVLCLYFSRAEYLTDFHPFTSWLKPCIVTLLHSHHTLYGKNWIFGPAILEFHKDENSCCQSIREKNVSGSIIGQL